MGSHVKKIAPSYYKNRTVLYNLLIRMEKIGLLYVALVDTTVAQKATMIVDNSKKVPRKKVARRKNAIVEDHTGTRNQILKETYCRSDVLHFS